MTATKAFITNFPLGMSTDIAIRNVPAVVTNSGRNLWADSNGPGGGTNPKGTFQRPYATVAAALGQAQNNDTIWVKAGHTETISAAAGWTFTGLTGVRVVGIGCGDERPQITFGTSTAATVTLNGAGCSILNIIGLTGINSLVSPFVVSASGCNLDIEWRDATSLEALRAVLTTNAAVHLGINLKYVGLIGSAVNVNAIRLVGGGDCRINIDYNGNPTTGVIEVLTTAIANLYVTGIINNASASTTHAKNIVDTVTGSHWAANYIDAWNAATTVLVQAVH